jgi:hypothetical protein
MKARIETVRIPQAEAKEPISKPRGDIRGRTRNRSHRTAITSGTMKTPHGFGIVPLTRPAASQCDGSGSGSRGERNAA